MLKALTILTVSFVLNCPTQAADWREVTSCSGYDLCLEDLVAARDLLESNAKYRFPYRSVIDVVLRVNLAVSKNCKNFIFVDSAKNLICTPNGNVRNSFVVAKKESESMDETSSTRFLSFDFKAPGRAKLYKDLTVRGAGAYYLDIK